MKIIWIRIITSLLFVFILQSAHPQSPTGIMPMNTNRPILLDSAHYAFTYRMSLIPDTTKANTISSNDYILLVGNKYSKFFNAYYFNKPKVEIIGESAPSIDGQGLGGTEIYKNLSEKSMTVTTILFGSNNVYMYEEKMPEISWKIEAEKKQIHGYTCQKAVTNYLGRRYTAWFTPEIPISNGPWRFGGLPGLILQVSDTREHYIFECSGIQRPVPKIPIDKYKVRYQNITRAELNQLIKRIHLNFVQYMEAQGKIHVNGSTKNISFPYNPIELE